MTTPTINGLNSISAAYPQLASSNTPQLPKKAAEDLHKNLLSTCNLEFLYNNKKTNLTFCILYFFQEFTKLANQRGLAVDWHIYGDFVFKNIQDLFGDNDLETNCIDVRAIISNPNFYTIKEILESVFTKLIQAENPKIQDQAKQYYTALAATDGIFYFDNLNQHFVNVRMGFFNVTFSVPVKFSSVAAYDAAYICFNPFKEIASASYTLYTQNPIYDFVDLKYLSTTKTIILKESNKYLTPFAITKLLIFLSKGYNIQDPHDTLRYQVELLKKDNYSHFVDAFTYLINNQNLKWVVLLNLFVALHKFNNNSKEIIEHFFSAFVFLDSSGSHPIKMDLEQALKSPLGFESLLNWFQQQIVEGSSPTLSYLGLTSSLPIVFNNQIFQIAIPAAKSNVELTVLELECPNILEVVQTNSSLNQNTAASIALALQNGKTSLEEIKNSHSLENYIVILKDLLFHTDVLSIDFIAVFQALAFSVDKNDLEAKKILIAYFGRFIKEVVNQDTFKQLLEKFEELDLLPQGSPIDFLNSESPFILWLDHLTTEVKNNLNQEMNATLQKLILENIKELSKNKAWLKKALQNASTPPSFTVKIPFDQACDYLVDDLKSNSCPQETIELFKYHKKYQAILEHLIKNGVSFKETYEAFISSIATTKASIQHQYKKIALEYFYIYACQNLNSFSKVLSHFIDLKWIPSNSNLLIKEDSLLLNWVGSLISTLDETNLDIAYALIEKNIDHLNLDNIKVILDKFDDYKHPLAVSIFDLYLKKLNSTQLEKEFEVFKRLVLEQPSNENLKKIAKVFLNSEKPFLITPQIQTYYANFIQAHNHLMDKAFKLNLISRSTVDEFYLEKIQMTSNPSLVVNYLFKITSILPIQFDILKASLNIVLTHPKSDTVVKVLVYCFSIVQEQNKKNLETYIIDIKDVTFFDLMQKTPELASLFPQTKVIKKEETNPKEKSKTPPNLKNAFVKEFNKGEKNAANILKFLNDNSDHVAEFITQASQILQILKILSKDAQSHRDVIKILKNCNSLFDKALLDYYLYAMELSPQKTFVFAFIENTLLDDDILAKIQEDQALLIQFIKIFNTYCNYNNQPTFLKECVVLFNPLLEKLSTLIPDLKPEQKKHFIEFYNNILQVIYEYKTLILKIDDIETAKYQISFSQNLDFFLSLIVHFANHFDESQARAISIFIQLLQNEDLNTDLLKKVNSSLNSFKSTAKKQQASNKAKLYFVFLIETLILKQELSSTRLEKALNIISEYIKDSVKTPEENFSNSLLILLTYEFMTLQHHFNTATFDLHVQFFKFFDEQTLGFPGELITDYFLNFLEKTCEKDALITFIHFCLRIIKKYTPDLALEPVLQDILNKLLSICLARGDSDEWITPILKTCLMKKFSVPSQVEILATLPTPIQLLVRLQVFLEKDKKELLTLQEDKIPELIDYIKNLTYPVKLTAPLVLCIMQIASKYNKYPAFSPLLLESYTTEKTPPAKLPEKLMKILLKVYIKDYTANKESLSIFFEKLLQLIAFLNRSSKSTKNCICYESLENENTVSLDAFDFSHLIDVTDKDAATTISNITSFFFCFYEQLTNHFQTLLNQAPLDPKAKEKFPSVQKLHDASIRCVYNWIKFLMVDTDALQLNAKDLENISSLYKAFLFSTSLKIRDLPGLIQPLEPALKQFSSSNQSNYLETSLNFIEYLKQQSTVPLNPYVSDSLFAFIFQGQYLVRGHGALNKIAFLKELFLKVYFSDSTLEEKRSKYQMIQKAMIDMIVPIINDETGLANTKIIKFILEVFNKSLFYEYQFCLQIFTQLYHELFIENHEKVNKQKAVFLYIEQGCILLTDYFERFRNNEDRSYLILLLKQFTDLSNSYEFDILTQQALYAAFIPIDSLSNKTHPGLKEIQPFFGPIRSKLTAFKNFPMK